MTTLPASLQTAFDNWSHAGHRDQDAFPWRPDAWKRRFSRPSAPTIQGVNLTETVERIALEASANLGDEARIDRGTVERLHQPKALGLETDDARQAVVTAFVAAMVWGYGTTGYGPFRTERVLTSDPEAVEHLVDVARIAQETTDGGLEAFEHIAEQNRNNRSFLKYLGPAFGTKFLYFLTAAAEDVEATPVMDAVVRRWFSSNTDQTLKTFRWDTDSYRTYLSKLDDWRELLPAKAKGRRLSRADVEFLIFATTRGDAVTWGQGPVSLDSGEYSIDQLLDLLHEDVEKLAETRGKEGPELFERLAAWVAGSDVDD